MKRDLDRWGDKLTPDEERRIWSKMKSALRESKSVDSARARPWILRPWVTSAAVAAAAVVVVVAVWKVHEPGQDLAGMSAPDQVTEAEAPSEPRDKKIDGEITKEQSAVSITGDRKDDVSQDQDIADGGPTETEPGSRGAGMAKPGTGDVGVEKAEFRAGEDQKPSAPDMAAAIEEESMEMMDTESAETLEGERVQLDARAHAKKDVPPAASGELTPKGKEEKLAQEARGPVAATKPPDEHAKSLMAVTESSSAATEGLVEAAPGRGKTAARSSVKKATASDTGEIHGQIADNLGNPLANAQVVVLGTRFGTLTDENGFYRIKNVPAGICSLRVTMTGYTELLVLGVAVEVDKSKDLMAFELSDKEAGGPDTIYFGIVGKSMSASIPQELELSEEASEEEYIPPTSFEPQVPQGAADEGAPEAKSHSELMFSPQRRAGETKSRGDGTKIRDRRKKDRFPDYPSLTGGSQPVNDDLADDMFFQHYGTNPFVDAGEDALSTFGLDVDTGSYTISRRYIREGHLPPTEAVRVEEFVNFFRKDFPPPRHDNLRIHIDGMPSPFAHVQDGSYWLLRVGIRGRVIDERDRPPAQIVLVVDTSGSMQGGNRLGMLKASMDVLLDEMRPDDEIGVVEFKTRARVVLPMTPLSEGRAIYRAIHSLHADGSTNAEHGLKLGYDMMRKRARKGRIHRIILCSDGVANEGNTGWEKILENVRRDRDRISLTTIGFGMGNYNDVLLEQLADAGDGQYAYVDELREATRVLRDNFTGTIQTIARDAKAQIEFDPRYVDKYRLLGYENRDVRDQDFRKDDVDAGEIGAGHEVTVLYEVKLKPEVGRRRLATVHLRYEQPGRGRVIELDEAVRIGDFWGDVYDAPADLIVDACVAEFAEILRGSYWAKDGSLDEVLDLLRDVTREMPSQPEVDELVDLVEKAIDLKESSGHEE
jgi:Ca-activated chloride channel family protein